MQVVAFVSLKGGAGKSTLASSVAVTAHLHGARVVVCDLDPLQSLVKWSRARKSQDIPVHAVEPDELAPLLSRLRRAGANLAVVDTPGANHRCCDAAIRAARLCVLPTRPNALDLWASEATLARVKAARTEYAFLLNQCPPAQQSARVARGARALAEMGALLTPMVSARVDYQEAVRLGLGVSELKPNSIAAREMAELWQSLSRRLRGGDEVETQTAQPPPAAGPDSLAAHYQILFDQALRVGGVYADFLQAMLPSAQATDKGPATGPPPAKTRRVS
jgi:chromosome partitioning protein